MKSKTRSERVGLRRTVLPKQQNCYCSCSTCDAITSVAEGSCVDFFAKMFKDKSFKLHILNEIIYSLISPFKLCLVLISRYVFKIMNYFKESILSIKCHICQCFISLLINFCFNLASRYCHRRTVYKYGLECSNGKYPFN